MLCHESNIAHIDVLNKRDGLTVLTPHEGEFRRLNIALEEERLTGAMIAARELGCILLRKGHESVITDGREYYINPTGNPGMAVGGSGDLLAGMITGLVGQGIHPLMSASCGAWLHGAAGDICASEIGQYGMIPSDMIQVLPRLLK